MTYETISTVIVPAVSYDLVDLDTVKDELGITVATYDDRLRRMIAQVSLALSRYCNRAFTLEEIEDRIYWRAASQLMQIQLARYPLARYAFPVTTAAVASGSVLPVRDVSAIEEQMRVSADGVTNGTVVSSVTASGDGSGNVTLSAPVTAAIASGTTIGFGLTVVETDGDPLYPMVDFTIDPLSCQLLRLASDGVSPSRWGTAALTIRYSAGYYEIPDDLQTAALQWITLRWNARGRDLALRSIEIPGVLSETYWVGGDMPGIPREVTDMLSAYAMPAFG